MFKLALRETGWGMIVINEIGFYFENQFKDEDWQHWEHIAEAAMCEHDHGNSPWSLLDAP